MTALKKIHLSALFAILLIAETSFAQTSFDWTPVHPIPPGVRYSGTAFGDGTWVAVGQNYIASTPDNGATWSSTRVGDETHVVDDVIYTGSKFIAFGGKQINGVGAVLLHESVDGLTWTEVDASRISATGNADRQRLLAGAMSPDGQEIVLGGFQGSLYRSADGGQTWTGEIYLPVDPSGHAQFGLIISGIAYGNGAFVMIQYSSDDRGLIISSSTDGGVTWNYQPTNQKVNIDSVAFGDGKFLIPVNDITSFETSTLTSTTGTDWTTTKTNLTSGSFYDLDFGNGLWVAVRAWPTDYVTSPDGINWTTLTGTGEALAAFGLTYADGKFLASGTGIKESTDGVVWSSFTADTPASSLNAATLANGTWVSVGDKGNIQTSTDNGLTWSLSDLTTTWKIRDIVWDGSNFVAIGQNAWISPDGLTWSEHRIGQFYPDIRTLAYGNGIYAGVGGNGDALRTTDPTSWTAVTLPVRATGNKIIYGNNEFLFVGEFFGTDGQKGYIFTSPDGETWTRVGPTDLRPFKHVAYGNDRYVVLGQNEFFGRTTVLTSTDKTEWTESTLMMDPGYVLFDGDQFVVVGTKIYTSVDGIQWKEVVESTGVNNLTGAAIDNGVLLGFGSQSTVLRTAWDGSFAPTALDSANDLGDGWFSLNWFGQYYRPSDLTDWIHHETLGWFRVLEEEGGLWLWNPSTGWIFTDATTFPYAWTADDSTWWYATEDSSWIPVGG